MMKNILTRPWLMFCLVIVWKITLFILSRQPVPANDAFFYDGPVVNYLLHGKYVNPSLALAFPISGTQVFSAYPPLYQAVLLAWMKLFGTSVVSAIELHLVLFALYDVVIFATLRRLSLPLWCLHVAGAFLFLITFHDRPDSIAHLLGALAIYCWIRSFNSGNPVEPAGSTGLWQAWTAACCVLALCASLQIGGIYLFVIWTGQLARLWFGSGPVRRIPMLCTLIIPMGLVALVKFGFPNLWSGFLEHAKQTPSLTGFRLPIPAEVLKVIRTVPGILAAAVLLIFCWLKADRAALKTSENARFLIVALACLAGGTAVILACMVILTPNLVAIANYLQPTIVGCCMAWGAMVLKEARPVRAMKWGFVALALFGSIRAIGMTTWGLACASDVSYADALARIRNELGATAKGHSVVLSSAFLYEAARHDGIRWVHSDWLHRLGPGQPSESDALAALKPDKIILTQFDYFRRYFWILPELKSRPALAEMQIEQTAKIPAPDSFASIQKVVQQISWAPIVVTLKWRE
jgi:hypothetical protein